VQVKSNAEVLIDRRLGNQCANNMLLLKQIYVQEREIITCRPYRSSELEIPHAVGILIRQISDELSPLV